MMRRRRPLMRAAVVGGVAYHAGKRGQQSRDQDAETDQRLADLESQQAQQAYAAPAPAPPAPAAGGISDAAIEQLKQLASLKDQGVLTDEEFEQQKRKLLS
jgi:hypothetical protein